MQIFVNPVRTAVVVHRRAAAAQEQHRCLSCHRVVIDRVVEGDPEQSFASRFDLAHIGAVEAVIHLSLGRKDVQHGAQSRLAESVQPRNCDNQAFAVGTGGHFAGETADRRKADLQVFQRQLAGFRNLDAAAQQIVEPQFRAGFPDDDGAGRQVVQRQSPGEAVAPFRNGERAAGLRFAQRSGRLAERFEIVRLSVARRAEVAHIELRRYSRRGEQRYQGRNQNLLHGPSFRYLTVLPPNCGCFTVSAS